MEEKKLTDEIKECLTAWCGDCPKKCYNEISRLQSENEELKAKRKKILANKVYSDTTLKKWSKEDLIEQIRILEHNWAAAEESLNNSAKNSEKIIADLKAEIERLKERNYWLESHHEYECEKSYFEGIEKGREKSIPDDDILEDYAHRMFDSWNDITGALHKGCSWYGEALSVIDDIVGMVYGITKRQTEKDTAKEILDGLLDIETKDNNYEVFFLDICEKLEKLSKKFGVEVE